MLTRPGRVCCHVNAEELDRLRRGPVALTIDDMVSSTSEALALSATASEKLGLLAERKASEADLFALVSALPCHRWRTTS